MATESGIEAAVHTMKRQYDEDTDVRSSFIDRRKQCIQLIKPSGCPTYNPWKMSFFPLFPQKLPQEPYGAICRRQQQK